MAKRRTTPKQPVKRQSIAVGGRGRPRANWWKQALGVDYYSNSLGEQEQPELQSATVTQTTTNVLDLVFDKAVNITTDGWTIASDGDAISITSVIADDGTTAPKFSLSRVVVPGEVLILSYDADTGDTTAVSGGVELASLTDQAVTNNVHILLEVNFSGTTVDTTKGTITNPDSANLTISQNNNLRFVRTTDTTIAAGDTNYWESVDSFTRGVFAVVFNSAVGYATSTWSFRYHVDANNWLSMQNNNGVVRIAVRNGGVTAYATDTVITNDNFSIRILYGDDNSIKFEYYTAGAWTQVGTTQNSNIGASGKIRISSASAGADATNDRMEFDSLRVTDEEYTTELPEDFFV